jgi:hypothetical protein
MDPGPTISRPYTRHKWVGRMICSQAIISARAQDLLRLPESMTIIKNRMDNVRFSFPLLFIRSYAQIVRIFFEVKTSNSDITGAAKNDRHTNCEIRSTLSYDDKGKYVNLRTTYQCN